MKIKRWQLLERYDGTPAPAQLGRYWTRQGAYRALRRISSKTLRDGGALVAEHFTWSVRPI